MKNYELFKTNYLNKALKSIHYKKLKKRIHEELSAHMDDMYEDLSRENDNEHEIINTIRKEMGSATKLGAELKEANKRKLLVARLFKIAFCILSIPLFISIISLTVFVIDDTIAYFQSYDIEEAEQKIINEYNDGQPIKHLIDIERSGEVFKFYIPEERKETGYDLFHTESIDFLGINIKNKFNGFYASNNNLSDNIIRLNAGPYSYSYNYYFVFFGPTEEKYIKLYYEPLNFSDNSKPYWSDFIEFPQNATYEEPIVIYAECPEGYCWSTVERFDENKMSIIYE